MKRLLRITLDLSFGRTEVHPSFVPIVFESSRPFDAAPGRGGTA
jgi:hypothetical protein